MPRLNYPPLPEASLGATAVRVVGHGSGTQSESTNRARRSRRNRGLAAAILFLCFASACERVAPPPADSLPTTQPISTVTPEDATRSLLGLLRTQLQAAARNDRTTVAKLRQLTLDKLVASDDVMARLGSAAGVTEKERAQVLDTLVTSWAATLAYYADGLALDQIQVHPMGPAAHETAVDVPARGRDDSTIVRVFCRRGKDNEWRVTGLEFVPRPATTTTVPSVKAPAESQPTTTSQP